MGNTSRKYEKQGCLTPVQELGLIVTRLFPKMMRVILRQNVPIQWLHRKYNQQNILFPLSEDEIHLMDALPCIDNFTVELCYKILRYEKLIDEPSCEWGNIPLDTEVSISDDIQRILNATNEIFSMQKECITKDAMKSYGEIILKLIGRMNAHFPKYGFFEIYCDIKRTDSFSSAILQELTWIRPVQFLKTTTNIITTSKERRARLGNLILKLFPRVMQTVLKRRIYPRALQVKYQQNDIRTALTESEISLMEKLPHMDAFTIELCYKILRYENLMLEPSCKWGNVPHDTEIEIADDVQRIITCTNEVICKISEEIPEKYYEDFQRNTQEILRRIDKYFQQDAFIRIYEEICRSEIDPPDIFQQLAGVQQVSVTQIVDEDSEKREYYSRIAQVIVDTFPNILRDIIRTHVHMSAHDLNLMCMKHLNDFTADQQSSLRALSSANPYTDMDITLIYRLLRTFSLIHSPTQGWGNVPDEVDTQLSDDVERIRIYRNKIAHMCNTNIEKNEFDHYFDQFRDIGHRMDLIFFQNTTYENKIIGQKKCWMDIQMQTKYQNALLKLEKIELRFENWPIMFHWGENFERSLMNLKSVLREEKSKGRRTVRVQIIIYRGESDVEETIGILNSLRDEINEGLCGIEFIVATRGSILLNVDILLDMMETDAILQSTLVLFMDRILERIPTPSSLRTDIVLTFVEEFTSRAKRKTSNVPVYLDFDIKSDLFENRNIMEKQLTKLSEIIDKHSNRSETDLHAIATLLPISLEQEYKTRTNAEPEKTDSVTESVCNAQAPRKSSLKFDVQLQQKFQIRKLKDNLLLLDCATVNKQFIFTDNCDKRLVVHNSDGSYYRDIKLSDKPLCISAINDSDVVVTFKKPSMQIININTGEKNDIKTNGQKCLWVSYRNDRLYANIDKKKIDVMNLKGEIINSFNSPSHVWYIATAENRLVMIDPTQDVLYCCDLHGSVLWKFTDQKIKRPYNVTTDGNGNTYVVCTLSHNVVVVSSNGEYHTEIQIKRDDLRDPTGIHYDKSGNSLLVFNRTSGKVLLYKINHSK